MTTSFGGSNSAGGSTSVGRLGYSGRYLATTHPQIYYAVAAADALLFTVLGAVLMPRSLGGGIAVIFCGLIASGFAALPAWWSERHPERAAQVVGQRRERSQRMARRHPLYFVVLLPIALAVDAALRWHTGTNNDAAHHGIWSWIVPALVGLIGGGVAGTALVVRARRAKPSDASVEQGGS
jgi:fructose-specific phosphotransferase system IIC component